MITVAARARAQNAASPAAMVGGQRLSLFKGGFSSALARPSAAESNVDWSGSMQWKLRLSSSTNKASLGGIDRTA